MKTNVARPATVAKQRHGSETVGQMRKRIMTDLRNSLKMLESSLMAVPGDFPASDRIVEDPLATCFYIAEQMRETAKRLDRAPFEDED